MLDIDCYDQGLGETLLQQECEILLFPFPSTTSNSIFKLFH